MRRWILDSGDYESLSGVDDGGGDLLRCQRNAASGCWRLDRRLYLYGMANGFGSDAVRWTNTECHEVHFRDRLVFLCDDCDCPAGTGASVAYGAG